MFDYFEQRKKIMNQYEDLANRLPKKYMNIHFKSINYKKGENKTIFLPSEILEQNKNENIIRSLDPETKSFILNNKNRLNFYKYSSSFDKFKSNQKKFKQKQMFNKQTIILTKYNNNIINDIRNNKINREIVEMEDINKRNKYIHINKDKYNNSYSGNILKKNNDSKEYKNYMPQKEALKVKREKTFSYSFYNEINKLKNKKNLEIINNENNNNYGKDHYINNFIYKNQNKNNHKCQTSFTSIKSSKEKDHSKKGINCDLLSLKKEEELLNLSNIKKYSEENKIIIQDNNKEKKYINDKQNSNIILKNTSKKKLDKSAQLLSDNGVKENMKKDLNQRKNNISFEKTKEINSYHYKEKAFNKLNLFYIDADFLKIKGNYLFGNNNNFLGKCIKNYQTKNNVFLPNLSLRIKSKHPRYDRQLDGFILA